MLSENTALRAEHIRAEAASLIDVAEPTSADGAIGAVVRAVADACLASDGPAMECAVSSLQVAAGDWENRGADEDRSVEAEWAEHRGRLYGVVELVTWLLQSRMAMASAKSVEPGSHAHRMLSLLLPGDDGRRDPLSSGDIAKRLGVDKTQVSRTGRELIERGLAATSSLGRKTFWDITPRGRYALEQLGTAVDGDGHAEVPLALILGELSEERAAELAAAVAGRHRGVTTYVVGRKAFEAAAVGRARRRQGPLMLVDVHRGRRTRLHEIERELSDALRSPVTSLEVSPTAESAFAVRSGATARRPVPD
jgi:DNA-binding MarR family transcriptional regulator